ncbi:unnamed protein product, partial [Prunus brigantina]
NKSWFDTYEVDNYDKVVMGNGSICRVKGKSTMKVKMYDGMVRTLGMVRYIPKLKKNLIFLGTYDKNGYSYKALEGKLIISKVHNCKLEFCKYCTMGKQSKVAFKQQDKENMSTGVLDYIHLDVWGPAPVKSLGGACYYVTLLDDFSMKVWVYFMMEKSEVFIKFTEWKAEVENLILY